TGGRDLEDCLVHNFDESTNFAGISARTGAISDCPRSSPTVDALWETAQTHGSFISTRDDLSRKVAVGRAHATRPAARKTLAKDVSQMAKSRGLPPTVQPLSKSITDNHKYHQPNTQSTADAQDEDGITLVFGKRAPTVGCPETDKYARDEDEEAQGDEEG
ncbi:hypothetical protein D6D29_02653, partial [Aureobasidium pullulans]